MALSRGRPNLGLLKSIPLVQRERLSFIDFRLYFLGELRRADVMTRFGTGPAGATRDIGTYREIAPQNLDFDSTAKAYRPSRAFKPIFEHPAQRVLTSLSQGFGQGLADNATPLVPSEVPTALSQPQLRVLAPVTRAIHRGKALQLVYHSLSSGRTERELVPLGLVDTGLRWHVRAFDRKSSEFRDFVFTRMEHPTILESSPILLDEAVECDIQWNRIIELELVPHPAHPRPEVVRMDYDMPDGVLRVKVRAANVGYILRRWNVDCSPNHRLVGPEYALWLRDSLVLYGATNAVVAPGYEDPRSGVKAPTHARPG